MKRYTLIILVVLAASLAGLCARPTMAFTSPIESPIMPPGLENCPGGCVEVLDCVGHPTCNAWCVEQAGADVAPEYISPAVVGGVCVWPTQPTTWHDAGMWMGAYRLWADDAGRYCLPDLAVCR